MKIDDVFQSPSCAIVTMKVRFGNMKLRAFLSKIIIETLMFFNVGKMMNDVQVALTVDLIIDEFGYFKPDDFKLCFTNAMKGNYGKLYDRIDGNIIFGWLRTYENDRFDTAENISIQESQKYKYNDKRTSDLQKDKDHDYKLSELMYNTGIR